MVNTETDPKHRYLQAARALNSQLPGHRAWIKALRERASARFDAVGFPTMRDEAWKYTNLASLVRQPFHAVSDATPLTREQLERLLPNAFDAFRLVFINGRYRPELSNPPHVDGREIARPLADALDRDAEALEPHLGQVVSIEAHPLAALNTAFLADGAYVSLPEGVALERPIHLIYVATADALAQPRALIVARSGSRATVVEQYVGIDESRYFTNAVTEVVLERGARVEHYRLQTESRLGFHVNGLHVRQHENSEFISQAIDLGGLLVRNDLYALLDAPGASCSLNGLYVADGRQHVDNHTYIAHAKPRCTSREFYKGVLDGRGRAVFNGRVVVQPDAQRTDAEQINNNLLLSEDAEIDTKPELEIYADDVKCSHGATVGQLDLDQLFYLRSRGVDDAQARDLLTFAFANDVLRRFRIAPLRAMLEHSITTRLLRGRKLRELELI
jgi:Fe-S cluster assembly protein SufD